MASRTRPDEPPVVQEPNPQQSAIGGPIRSTPKPGDNPIGTLGSNPYKVGQFSDVNPDAYYAPYVQALAQRGILAGTGGGAFNPMGGIDFDTVARLLQSQFGTPPGLSQQWSGGQAGTGPITRQRFMDLLGGAMSLGSNPYQQLIQRGITTGQDMGSMLSRGDMAVMLAKALGIQPNTLQGGGGEPAPYQPPQAMGSGLSGQMSVTPTPPGMTNSAPAPRPVPYQGRGPSGQTVPYPAGPMPGVQPPANSGGNPYIKFNNGNLAL